MLIPKKIINFLEKAKIKYEIVKHRQVYTAFDKAQTLCLPERMVGKTLILKTDKNLVISLIPANKNLDKNKFKKLAHPLCGYPKKLEFVSEKIIKNKLKGVKVGAIPPLGPLWELPTFVDRLLMIQPKIIINGGDYNWSIKINPRILKKIIPDLVIGSFSKTRK